MQSFGGVSLVHIMTVRRKRDGHVVSHAYFIPGLVLTATGRVASLLLIMAE